MTKCGCCGEVGHSVTQCTSPVVCQFVKVFTELLPHEQAIEFVKFGLNNWQLTAVINYLDGTNRRHSKMRKQLKIATIVQKLHAIQLAETLAGITTRPYLEFATNLHAQLSLEFEPITTTMELTVFRTIIRKAVRIIINAYREYDIVRLVNQHFIRRCLPSGLNCLFQLISVRFINNAFTALQEEARREAYSNSHLKKLVIVVTTTQAATFNGTEECQICVDPSNKEFVQLNCEHVICKICVADIAERRNKSFILCPYCREEIKQVGVVDDAENTLQLVLNRA